LVLVGERADTNVGAGAILEMRPEIVDTDEAVRALIVVVAIAFAVVAFASIRAIIGISRGVSSMTPIRHMNRRIQASFGPVVKTKVGRYTVGPHANDLRSLAIGIRITIRHTFRTRAVGGTVVPVPKIAGSNTVFRVHNGDGIISHTYGVVTRISEPSTKGLYAYGTGYALAGKVNVACPHSVVARTVVPTIVHAGGLAEGECHLRGVTVYVRSIRRRIDASIDRSTPTEV
jgi:hypothetical protein